MVIESAKLVSILDRLLASGRIVVSEKQLSGLLTSCRARIAADAAWPSHSEELERKAIESTNAVVHRVVAASITPQAGAEAVSAIYDTVSGLIGNETLDILNQVLRELRAQ